MRWFILKVKSLVNTEDKKRLLSNFISLFILQGLNYLLPLITLPYLVRILGVENFGLLAFVSVTIAYFSIITDYGFTLTAAREISIHKDKREKVTEIFSAVITIQFFLMLLSSLLLSVLVFSIERFRHDAIVYFFTFGLVIAQVLFPVWFFQGMEKMKYITYINIGSKFFFTLMIFIFVQNENDFYKVPLLTSIGNILAALWALYIIKTKFSIRFQWQSIDTLKHYQKEAHHIFVSNIAISLYTVSTTFILGLFTNNIVVGYFAAADKIIQAFKGLMSPVFQTIYPYISQKAQQSKENGLHFIKKITFYIIITTGVISLFIFIFAEFLVNIILGTGYQNSIIIVKILAFMPLVIGLSNMFGVQTMLNFGRKKAFSKILIVGSIINLLLSFLLVPLYQEIGSAISLLIVESFITIAMFIYLQKNELKIVGEMNRV